MHMYVRITQLPDIYIIITSTNIFGINENIDFFFKYIFNILLYSIYLDN